MARVTEVCGVPDHCGVNSSPPLCGLRLLCNTAGHQRKQSVPHTDLSQGYSPWIELLPLDLQTCLSQSYSPWIELLPFDLKLYHQASLELFSLDRVISL